MFLQHASGTCGLWSIPQLLQMIAVGAQSCGQSFISRVVFSAACRTRRRIIRTGVSVSGGCTVHDSTRGSDLPPFLIRFCWRGQLLVDYFAGSDGEGLCEELVGLSAGRIWQRIVTLTLEESAIVWARLEIMFCTWPWILLRADDTTLVAFFDEHWCTLATHVGNEVGSWGRVILCSLD